MSRKRIHYIYSILLSVVLILAGLCLMAACVGIYNAGDQPFSREAVATAFSRISIPVYLCLGMVIAGFLLDLFFPDTPVKSTPQKHYPMILERLHAETDLAQCDPAISQAVLEQQKKRKLHKTISGVLLAVGCIVFLIYALNSSNYHQSQITDSMICAVYLLLPCMAVPGAYAIFTSFYCSASIRKEIELLKKAGSAGGKADIKTTDSKNRRNYTAIVRNVILAAAIVFLLYGYFSGGTEDVLTKAINICTECVGLG